MFASSLALIGGSVPTYAARDPLSDLFGGYGSPTAMTGFGCFMAVASVVVGLLLLIFAIYCHWRICAKAGYSGALSLIMLIPLIGPIILLLIIAFGNWPISRQSEKK